ncbi:rhodanese-like domain-containing protein [Kingella kingae]|uniref:rhodanese-like domain-containing protein n=2 Tax=Kingella kingae TaxID=504 RepID=UPI00040BDDD8|nr:rhodanese-like domain-containing protein [Kingella kingae]MDK4525466.1 rhodanese-like domain-containing protein [Kingella kingae]MDK4531491.1 rhodanese-like domain-containing protein [Kingella kingae]
MKKLVSTLLMAAALIAPVASQAAQPNSVTQTAQPPRAKGVWIDVRTAEEFQQGHLQGAHNIPVDAITAQIAKVEPNKNAPVNLYCRSGRRAEVALQELRKMGYTNVTNHGGYQDLLAKGIR